MKNINWKTWPYWKRGATHGLLFAMIWPILFFSTTGGTLNKISNYFISTLFLCVLCICLGAISGIIVELENNFMSKRNLRYWIRGGIFASTIPLIILIILAVIGSVFSHYGTAGNTGLLLLPFIIIALFIIGAIFGSIYSKIRNPNITTPHNP